jgi:hypothetical protein
LGERSDESLAGAVSLADRYGSMRFFRELSRNLRGLRAAPRLKTNQDCGKVISSRTRRNVVEVNDVRNLSRGYGGPTIGVEFRPRLQGWIRLSWEKSWR